MENFKKYFMLLPLLLLAVVSLSSCGDDKEEEKKDEPAAAVNALVGIWVADDGDGVETLILNADGTGRDTYSDEYGTESFAITWSVSGNVLTIVDEDGDSYSDVYQLMSDNKVLVWNDCTFMRR